jgi:hypothetical protein
MTGVEKIKMISTILEKAGKFPGLTCKDAEEIRELREGIKVSDWFKWLDEDESSLEKFYKVFGFTATAGGRMNKKLQEAVDGGYVKMYQVKQYGRYFDRIKLTAKGKKLLA